MLSAHTSLSCLILLKHTQHKSAETDMELTGYGALFLVTLISCIVFLSSWKKKSRLPPGPTPLPLIGNILQMKRGQLVKSLIRLSEKYGPVYTIYLGSHPTVVLCGYDAVKEALVDHGEEFSGRGKTAIFDRLFNDSSIIFSSGEQWKSLRRFSIMTLRNFGMGKKSIEERIQEEACFLVKDIRKMKESPFDPSLILHLAVSNVICSIVFHSRFDYDDEEFLRLLHLMNEIFDLLNSVSGQMYDMFPRIMKFLPGPHQAIFKYFEEIIQFGADRVKCNQESFDPSVTRDYIDCFLKKMEQEKHNPSSVFNLKNLVLNIENLFFAGTETVSSTLRYGFLILLKHPQITEKLQTEIDNVIGRKRQPAIEDRNKMHYTEAVIHEVQRYIDMFPMGVMHSVIQDTQFRGFTIPKGTNVMPMLTTVLKDPAQFKDPETFDPGHFLDDKGCFKKHNAFVPFSTGKRICLGEGLARMELFLFFTTILQQFNISSPIDMEKFDITPRTTGFANEPPLYLLFFTDR